MWSSYKEEVAINAELLRQIGIYKKSLKNAGEQIGNLEEIKLEYQANKADCENQIELLGKTIKSRDKDVKKLKVHLGILGTTVVVLAGVIVYLSIEK